MSKYSSIAAALLSALLGTACMGMHDEGMRSGGSSMDRGMGSGSTRGGTMDSGPRTPSSPNESKGGPDGSR